MDGEFPDYDSVQRLTYLEMCLSEAMRAYNPTFIVDRVCNTDTHIQGVNIPAGQTVVFPLVSKGGGGIFWGKKNRRNVPL